MDKKVQQFLIFILFLITLRCGINQIQIPLFNESPNQKFILIFLSIWIVYAILKHNGLLPKKNIQNQHVFITGGAMGIGKQMALLLAQQKCKITIVDINTEEGKKTQEEIKKINQQVEYIYCDVSNQESVQKAALQSTQKFGNVDILINNAGIVVGKHILETSCKAVENTIKINAISHFYTIKEFLPKMVENNKGHIVTIASILGHMSVSQLADYCASKFAAVGLNEGLRMELNIMNSEVKTTCVCPYQINTGMFKGTSPPKLIQKLVPELDEVYVAKRVIQGIRQDEEMIIMPVSLYFAVFIKSFLPVWLIDAIVQIGGINGSVSGFIGRGKKE